MIDTALTIIAGISAPILLAPMGGVAGGRLAAAVSNAGGLGLVGGGYAEPGWLTRELTLAGGARVGVGFITFALDQRPDTLRIALERRPVAIQLSFGDPAPYADRIHASGALLISQAQTVDEARRAADVGADIVIAQGQDCGGHGRPGRGTIGLVPAIVDAVAPLPVVAAGGIADDTTRTPVFDLVRGPAWPDGYDGRVLRNATVEQWEDDSSPASRAALAATYGDAAATDYTIRALWVGEGLDLIHAVPSAEQVLADIVAEATHVVRSTAAALSDAFGDNREGRS